MSQADEPTREQLQQLEARLRAVEARLGMGGSPPPSPAPAPATPASVPRAQPPVASSVPEASAWQLSVTGVMASGAGVAFVLAAIYFLKLVYDFGWLTPERQVALALLGGIGLIAAGVGLGVKDRGYAAYLPAAGVVILYITIYAADLYYGMIGTRMVVAGVGATTLTAVWLQGHFGRSIYALFAVIGTYLFPIMLPSTSPAAFDLIVYFAAWGLLFSWISLQQADRSIYLLALWFSLLGFDAAWRISAAADAWQPAAVYQFAQFLLFTGTAAAFSIRHRKPLGSIDAITHGAALFTFYGLEYTLLKQHVPSMAPGIALASVVVVLVILAITRSSMGDAARGGAGATVASAYAAFVTSQVLLFEILPDRWFAWGALLLSGAVMALGPLAARQPGALTPARLITGIFAMFGLFQLAAAEPASDDVAFPLPGLLIYAAFLYVGALRGRAALGRHPHPPLLLYAGHVTLMVATVKALDSALMVSIAWAVLAVALLLIALRAGDRVLGRSSLLIFFASSLKVLLYDLDGSPTLVRVIILIVLGCSLYAGGWLYQRVPDGGTASSPSD